MSPLRKIEKIYLLLRHKDTRIHKEFSFNDLPLVQHSALVPWWQKNTFQIGLKD